KGALVINAKGDYEFAQEIYSYWKENIDSEQEFKFINLADKDYSHTYSPIFRGTGMEIRDRIVGAIDWGDIYYKSRSQQVLRLICQAVENLEKTATIMDIYSLVSDKNAMNRMKNELKDEKLKNEITNEIYKNEDYDHQISGLKSAIGDIAKGAFGEIINTYNPDVDLLESYRNNDIVFVNLPTTLIGESARAFGKMLLMDLKTLTGEIEKGKAKKHFYPIYIDEFAEIATSEFIGLLNKARSAGLKIHLAYQSIGDLEQVDTSFVKQVIDNTNLNLIFRNNEDTSTEKLAKLIGTKKSLKETARVDKNLISQSESDEGSIRETEEFYINPNVIKQLKRGQAIIFGKQPEFFYNLIYTDFIEENYKQQKIEIKKYKKNKNENALNVFENYIKNKDDKTQPESQPEFNPIPKPKNDNEKIDIKIFKPDKNKTNTNSKKTEKENEKDDLADNLLWNSY
ncbi:MAG: type IV secretory system conjugative DNA transfer family protein, partial [Bacillota bacterium]